MARFRVRPSVNDPLRRYPARGGIGQWLGFRSPHAVIEPTDDEAQRAVMAQTVEVGFGPHAIGARLAKVSPPRGRFVGGFV
jgi:hypothetical protein